MSEEEGILNAYAVREKIIKNDITCEDVPQFFQSVLDLRPMDV